MNVVLPRIGLAVCTACAMALAGRIAIAQVGLDFGASRDEAQSEQPPVYEVEFLIFAYNEFNPLEEEFEASKPKRPPAFSDIRLTAMPETLQPSSADWYLDSLTLPDIREPTTDPTISADGAADYAPGPTTPAPLDPQFDDTDNVFGPRIETAEEPDTWYRMLEADDLELGRAVARLRTLDAYTPLLHGGWSQAALLEDEAVPLELAMFGRLQPAGSIRLHRSRFLHLTIDVSLQNDYRYRQAPIAPNARWPLAEFQGPTRYAIRVQRRIRSGELHFFDHPAFGILVIVREAPEEPETEDALTPRPAA